MKKVPQKETAPCSTTKWPSRRIVSTRQQAGGIVLLDMYRVFAPCRCCCRHLPDSMKLNGIGGERKWVRGESRLCLFFSSRQRYSPFVLRYSGRFPGRRHLLAFAVAAMNANDGHALREAVAPTQERATSQVSVFLLCVRVVQNLYVKQFERVVVNSDTVRSRRFRWIVALVDDGAQLNG